MGLHALDSDTRPLFFHRRIHSRGESLKWTSRGQNGAGGQHRILRVEAADRGLPSAAPSLAFAFSAMSCLLWLRGLSVLRFAGRGPLPDSSHKEEAGRRFFGGERSRGRFAERRAPCPSGSEGLGLTLRPSLSFAGSRLRGFAHGGEQRETVPGNCRAGPVDDLTDRSLSLYGACQVELEDRVFDVG